LTPPIIRRDGDDMIRKFRIARVWTVQEWSYNMTDTKNTGIFNRFINLELIKSKVLIVRLAIGCVSRRRDACYKLNNTLK